MPVQHVLISQSVCLRISRLAVFKAGAAPYLLSLDILPNALGFSDVAVDVVALSALLPKGPA